MNTVKEVLTHIHTQAKINQLIKARALELNALNKQLARELFNDGYDLTVKECALLLNMGEGAVRNYMNPKQNRLTPVYVSGKTFVLYQSIESFLKSGVSKKTLINIE